MNSTAIAADAAAVLLVDVDDALASLFSEWLADRGLRTVHSASPEAAVAVIDIPYPREDGAERLRALAQRQPHTPVVVIVPTCRPSNACCEAAARQLGVVAAVAAPVRRETLLAAIETALLARR